MGQLDDSQAEGYGRTVDLWSLGVILYVMCVGQPPFQGVTRDKLFEAIKIGQLSFDAPHWSQLSAHVQDLITKLLDHNPATRYDVNQTLSHPWLQDLEVIRRYKEVIMPPPQLPPGAMGPPPLKTGITKAFQDKTKISATPAEPPKVPAYQKPTLANVPPPASRQQSTSSTKTDPASDDDQDLMTTTTTTSRSESESPTGSTVITPMDNDNAVAPTSSSWGTLTFKVHRVQSFSLPESVPLNLTQPSYTIGRGKGCEIEITAEGISKEHCRVYFADGEAFLEDRR